MDRQLVTSSNVRSIGYDPTAGTLEVEFYKGSIYQYFNVPETVYAALIRASSKGRYLNDQIKGRYRFRKIC
jgi:hypothetical protein